MARERGSKYDQLVNRQAIALITTVPFKWRTISKIDADSVPAGHFKGCWFSLMDNTSDDDNVSYMIYAALDDGIAFSEDRVVGHVAISPGGGSAWLAVNRSIWHRESGDVGGPITIWMECSDNIDSTTVVSTTYTQRLKVSS